MDRSCKAEASQQQCEEQHKELTQQMGELQDQEVVQTAQITELLGEPLLHSYLIRLLFSFVDVPLLAD